MSRRVLLGLGFGILSVMSVAAQEPVLPPELVALQQKYHDAIQPIAVRADDMTISVDEDIRFEGKGDYSTLDAPLGIGPSWGSVVTVESFAVEPM